MEYWDLYDYKGNKKKKIAIRGTKLNNDDFHLVVNAWILNDNGEFLITQRSANKSHPLMWECTGGSVIVGEDTYNAAIREVKEELSVDLNGVRYDFIGSVNRYYKGCPDILDVYLFYIDIPIECIKFQEEEICEVKWASKDEILNLYNNSEFEANAYFEEVLNFK